MKPKVRANEFTDFGGPSAFDPTPLERRLMQNNLSNIVGRAVFDIISKPPKISRLPQKESDLIPIIQNAEGTGGNKETHLQTDLTLTIPVNGEELVELLQKTGMKDLAAILERLETIAVEERMGIIIAYDDGEPMGNAGEKPAEGLNSATGSVIVNLHRTLNLAYYPRMNEKNEEFLNLFEWELY